MCECFENLVKRIEDDEGDFKDYKEVRVADDAFIIGDGKLSSSHNVRLLYKMIKKDGTLTKKDFDAKVIMAFGPVLLKHRPELLDPV